MTSPNDRSTSDPPVSPGQVVDQAVQLGRDAKRLLEDARTTSGDLEKAIKTQFDRHPLATVGAAVGAGFVLGGGLSPSVLRLASGIAGRAAIVFATKQLLAIVDPGNQTIDNQTSPPDPREENS